MSSFVFEENRFVYHDDAGNKCVLLDCNDLLQNKSRLPFSSLDDKSLTAPALIMDLLSRHPEVCAGSGQEDQGVYYVLTDVLLTAHHVKTSAPKKILELGCVNGVMSWHLASVLGQLHPDSLLYCVSDVMGNESGDQWLGNVLQAAKLPRLGFAAVDLHDTNLQDGNFDMTVINGSVPMDQPDLVIKEAQRVTREGGIIMVYAENQPLLESAFKLLTDARQEFSFDHRRQLMTTEV